MSDILRIKDKQFKTRVSFTPTYGDEIVVRIVGDVSTINGGVGLSFNKAAKLYTWLGDWLIAQSEKEAADE